MKWELKKRFGYWCLVGLFYRTFESFDEAWLWIDTHLYSEPPA